MKKAALLFVPVLGLASHSPAFASDSGEQKFNLYIGADAQVRRMDFKGGYGDNLLRHNSPQGNGYVGLKFNEYLALEMGYESTVTRNRLTTLTTGDVSAGTPVLAVVSPVIFRSKIKMKGPHVDVVGFYSFYEASPAQLFGSVGVAFIKGTAQRQTVSMANQPASTVRTLSGDKRVMRLAGGLQYMLGDHLGLRGTVGWSDTNRFVISSNDNLPGLRLPEIKPKGTTFYGLGLLWAF